MNVIIPMTGYGSRFVAAGYGELKPMIPVLGRPVIEWILKYMFSEDDHFYLICREEHLESGKLDEDYLRSLMPSVTVLKIGQWEKLGPVYDIMRVAQAFDGNAPCVVNYCDFFVLWDWDGVKGMLSARGCDGAVLAFTGFQPCLVPKHNVYASCLCDPSDNLIEIREKYSFAEDKFKGRHSTGTYYFKTGNLMKQAFQETIRNKDMLKGEYYASLPYNYLVRAGYEVWVPVLCDYFYTWGTPYDMEEFIYWAETIRRWVS